VSGILYRCDICEQGERRDRVRLGSDDDGARVAGWRIGATQSKERNVICPECAGTDEEYWDRRLLDVAYMSGMASFMLNDPGSEATP
jgi:hypothetical protein